MKILITAPFHDEYRTQLQKKCEVVYENWRETGTLFLDSDELIQKINTLSIDIFITEADEVDDQVIQNTSLSLIASTRGTPRNIDHKAAAKKQIPVIYTPHRNADAVADLTVAMMLCQARKIIEIDRFLRKGNFDVSDLEEGEFAQFLTRYQGVELGGLTVGIIGLGAIGQRVAQRLNLGFGAKILFYDPYVSEDHPVAQETDSRQVPLKQLMRESDMITIHTPPLPETEELIGEDEFNLMKPTAHFFNLARSFCINEDALYEALKTKRIAGAGLDVFDDEPVDSDNRFLEFENVTVMPHFGGNTRDVVRHQSQMITEDVLNFLSNKPLKNTWPLS
ncbi:MAG: NAD(P)-dependent oxidoreductase [Candidatus Thorarchaeota archaeon]